LSGGNRKSSATDGGQSNWRHNQPIGSGRTQRPSTRDISSISSRGERPQIPWCVTMEDSVCQHGDLELDSLRYTPPKLVINHLFVPQPAVCSGKWRQTAKWRPPSSHPENDNDRLEVNKQCQGRQTFIGVTVIELVVGISHHAHRRSCCNTDQAM